MDFNDDEELPEHSQNYECNSASTEFHDIEYLDASASGAHCEPNASTTSSEIPPESAYTEATPRTSQETSESTTRSKATPTPRGRQLGRGQRFSDTGVQTMESHILKTLQSMQADKKEDKKRKLDLQERMLNIEERKLELKQQKIDALKSIDQTLQQYFNRNHQC